MRKRGDSRGHPVLVLAGDSDDMQIWSGRGRSMIECHSGISGVLTLATTIVR